MISTDETAISTLNSLIVCCKDAEQGFLTAATDVNDPDLMRAFIDYAKERTKFIKQLQKRVCVLRGNPEQGGSAAAAVHRKWMDFEARNASQVTHAILAECERGEDIAVSVYRAALQEESIDGQTRRLIQRQYEAVQAAHDRVRQLRDRRPGP